MDECLFCKIVKGEIPSTLVYQDEQVLAFRDINPVAPTHILVIPRKHILNINDVSTDDEQLLGHMLTVVKPIAEQEGITESGYRLIINCNQHGGQEVYHLHLHLVGGRPLGRMLQPQ